MLMEVATTMPSQEQPDAATVVSEGVAQSMLPAAQATVPDAGQMEEDVARGSPTLMSQVPSDAAIVASEGAAQSVPPEAQAEVTLTTISPTT